MSQSILFSSIYSCTLRCVGKTTKFRKERDVCVLANFTCNKALEVVLVDLHREEDSVCVPLLLQNTEYVTAHKVIWKYVYPDNITHVSCSFYVQLLCILLHALHMGASNYAVLKSHFVFGCVPWKFYIE